MLYLKKLRALELPTLHNYTAVSSKVNEVVNKINITIT